MKLNINVPVRPVSQPRYEQRWVISKRGRKKRIAYASSRKRGKPHPIYEYKETLKFQALKVLKDNPNWDKKRPMDVGITFVFGRPKKFAEGDRRVHCCKPDVDNLTKSVLDAFNDVLWGDDSQVTDLRVGKRYSASDEDACVEVEVKYTELKQQGEESSLILEKSKRVKRGHKKH